MALDENLPTRRSLDQPFASPSERKRAIGALLTRLSVMYWRPHMPQALSDAMLEDFVSDLERYSVADIAAGCAAYRRDPSKTFFPTPGQLIAAIRDATFRLHETPQRPTVRALPPVYKAAPPESIVTIGDVLRRLGQPNAAAHYEETGKIVPRYALDPTSTAGTR